MTFHRHWREHRGPTVAEVAARLDLPTAVIHNIECGLSQAGPAVMRRLALLYGCSPTDLRNEDPALLTADREVRQ